MTKHFVLDTNVLLHDPGAVERFGDEEVVVPIYAIEEIDRFKHELSERGRHARMVSRHLDALRRGANLAEGAPTEGGGRLRVAFVTRDGRPPDPAAHPRSADDLILAVALQEQERHPGEPVVFVTRDVNLRIRADALGLHAEDYRDQPISIEELYTGVAELEADGADIDRLYKEGALPWEGLRPNQCAVLRDRANASHTALARLHGGDRLALLQPRKGSVWGIHGRNKEQRFALDLLLDEEVKLVTLAGRAGTGKTLLAIAAGLEQVVERRRYRKLLVSRPIFPLGRDIGFLPGDIEEKLNPWMKPIYDNLELLLASGGAPAEGRDGGAGQERSYEELIHMGYLEVEPLTYIRGRSIPHQFMIVDEAQNLTPHEVKTIVTRVGEGTKIVLTGDPYQIDNPYVDSTNNGLSTLVERFKDEPLAGHATLVKGERSELAERAATLL